MKLVRTEKLKEHDKNGYYFTDVEGEKYEEIKKSIVTHGIRDPIKVMQKLDPSGDSYYVVISGHQRLRIARDLKMDKVPVDVIPDITDEEAEYLLIAENVERRGQAETDPIKKSRIANFLKEYWGVRDGSAGRRSLEGQNAPQKTLSDISETMGESERNTKRILKLHDLIPELQQLVSEGKLGTTAAEQLAYLSEEEQKVLLSVKGDSISSTTVSDAKAYRKESKQSNGDLELYKKRIKDLERKLEELENKEPKVIEVVPDHIKQKIEQLNNALAQTEKEKRDIENKLKSIESKQNDILKQEEVLELKRKQLENQAHISIYDLQIKIHEFIKDASPSVFLQGAVASSSFKLKDDLLDSVIALEEFTKKLRDILNAEIIEDGEIIINSNYYEEEF